METLLDRINKGEVEVSVKITFNCIIDRHQYDLGIVTLERSSRGLHLDVVESYACDDDNHTTIFSILEFDEEVLEDCPKDLKESDLLDLRVATMYIGSEWEVEPDSITLFIISDGSTRTIELEMDL